MELAKHNPTILMLDVDYTKEEFFKLFPYAKTFPQIIINGNVIGGYSELDGLSF
jgi:glutaredoxin